MWVQPMGQNSTRSYWKAAEDPASLSLGGLFTNLSPRIKLVVEKLTEERPGGNWWKGVQLSYGGVSQHLPHLEDPDGYWQEDDPVAKCVNDPSAGGKVCSF